jgi:hypothetical protein
MRKRILGGRFGGMSPKNAITTFSMNEKQMAIKQLYAPFKNIEYTYKE